MTDRRLDPMRAQMRNTKERIDHQLIDNGQRHAASCKELPAKKSEGDNIIPHLNTISILIK